jgi:hypothetical protein
MRTWMLVAALAVGGFGCTKTPAYVYGVDLTNLMFHPFSTTEGVYPDRTVLDDPANPFATNPPTEDGKWTLQANAGPVASFYSWATLNTLNPYGEAQFYAAHDLQQTFHTGQAAEADLPAVRDLAIHGFQVVLDAFPDSVTYDSSGKIAFSLATLACIGITDLGGTIQGGWVLVKGEDGADHAVKP